MFSMIRDIDVWRLGEKSNKWYLAFNISGSNLYISLSDLEMRKLSKKLKGAGF